MGEGEEGYEELAEGEARIANYTKGGLKVREKRAESRGIDDKTRDEIDEMRWVHLLTRGDRGREGREERETERASEGERGREGSFVCGSGV